MIGFQYDDGGRRAAGFPDVRAGDCVCRSISIAAQLPYAEVHQYLSQHNASQRRNRFEVRNGKCRSATADRGITTRRKWFQDYMKQLGFTWHPTMTIGSGCKVHLSAAELPLGRIICRVSRHYVAVINRVVHDTYNPDRDGLRCVYGYWEYTK